MFECEFLNYIFLLKGLIFIFLLHFEDMGNPKSLEEGEEEEEEVKQQEG